MNYTRALVLLMTLFCFVPYAQEKPKPAPDKLTDQEKLHLRELQVKQLQLQTQLSQLAQQYQQTMGQLTQANQNLQEGLAGMQQKHNCPGCNLDDNLDFILPKEPPK